MRAACDLAARVVGFLSLRRINMSNNINDHPGKSEFEMASTWDFQHPSLRVRNNPVLNAFQRVAQIDG